MKSNISKTFTKVGRITMPIARAAKMKAADICVDNNHVRHVANEHKRELTQLGISAIDLIKLVATSFNRIYQAKKGCFFIVIYDSKQTGKTRSALSN
ncbi:MAG: hypothetical protein LBR45_03985 [Bacteroidales bacterium]|jgi:hypothetical protein|nr:hypothetical protein [Bacteroidales bacterium]